MCVCVRVCACARARVRACVRACAMEKEIGSSHKHRQTHLKADHFHCSDVRQAVLVWGLFTHHAFATYDGDGVNSCTLWSENYSKAASTRVEASLSWRVSSGTLRCEELCFQLSD